MREKTDLGSRRACSSLIYRDGGFSSFNDEQQGRKHRKIKGAKIGELISQNQQEKQQEIIRTK